MVDAASVEGSQYLQGMRKRSFVMARVLTISGMIGMLMTAENLLTREDRGEFLPALTCVFTPHGDVASCERSPAMGDDPLRRRSSDTALKN